MSLSLDFNAMLTQAFAIINGLWPIFIVPVGFGLGISLLSWIVDEVRSSVGRRR